MKIKFSYIIQLVTLILLSSCSGTSINDIESAKKYIQSKNFSDVDGYGSKNYVFTFNSDNSCNLNIRDKRGSENESYNGTYVVKQGKYENTGNPFYYVKLTFNPNEWTNHYWFVIHNGELIVPWQGDGNLGGHAVNEEDSYGLIVKDYQVSMSTDIHKYIPQNK